MLSVYKASAGSGKTFTLVKEFLKILFLQTNQKNYFNRILAITFTNKASIEMKNRLLNALMDFANNDDLYNNQLFLSLNKEINIDHIAIKQKSLKILEEILHNYSLFSISTIDKFTYRLIKVFSKDLNLNSNFSTEVDDKKLIEEATDIFISKLEDKKNYINSILKEFILYKLNDNKSWDISYDIKELVTKILTKEESFEYLKYLNQITSEDFIRSFKKQKKEKLDFENEIRDIVSKIENTFIKNNITPDDLLYGKTNGIKSTISKINKQNYSDINKKSENKRFLNYLSDKKLTKKDIQISSEVEDAIYNHCLQINSILEKKLDDYILSTSILKNIFPTAIVSEIVKELQKIKEDKNIIFISEFNSTIKEYIKDEPVPFIYERLGERYRHFFIDEFQDTSTFQWENIKPLLDNQLSQTNEKSLQNGSTMLVGDIKQSIYRWRGGNVDQFIHLASKDELYNNGIIQKVVHTLPHNFRSAKNIVAFCNDFFKESSNLIENEEFKKIYSEENNQIPFSEKEGFVNIKILSKNTNDDIETEGDNKQSEDITIKKTLSLIKTLLHSGWNKKDICILVRKNDQGVKISEELERNKINILSSETLLLKNSPEVILLISLLEFLNSPNDYNLRFNLINKLYELGLLSDDLCYYHNNLKKDSFFFKFFNRFLDIPNLKTLLEKNLYDLLFFLIKKLNLNVKNNYISFLLDNVLDFSLNKKSDLNSFLEYWNISGKEKSISVFGDIDAIKIMTIHKSKGLEFPVVIIPFTNDDNNKTDFFWKNIEDNNIKNLYFSKNKKLEGNKYFKDDIHKIKDAKISDYINIMYVAFTRAKEELYIFCTKKEELINNKFINHFFEKNNIPKSEYLLGTKKLNSHKIEIKTQEENYAVNLDFNHWDKKITLSYEHLKTPSLFGDILHETLSKIKYSKDLEKVSFFLNTSFQINQYDQEKILDLIKEVVNNDILYRYYSEEYDVLNENDILINGDIIRPDRICIKNNNIVIIDYKSGLKKPQHKNQIKNYAFSLIEMGYIIDKLFLVYLNENIEIIDIN